MAIFEPHRYEPEEQLEIPIHGADKCYVISGFADFSFGDGHLTHGPLSDIKGDSSDDDYWISHNLYMTVGPEFFEVKDVSPTAGIAGHWFKDSDVTDATGIELETCKWDTVSGESGTNRERIRLKVKLRMCGGRDSMVSKISYHLVTIVSDPNVQG